MHLWRSVMTLLVAVALPVGAGEEPVASSAGEPAGIEPEFVRPLVPIARGRNDSNPVWSPAGDLVAFERSRGDNKEIAIVRINGDVVQTIHQQAPVAPGQSVRTTMTLKVNGGSSDCASLPYDNTPNSVIRARTKITNA